MAESVGAFSFSSFLITELTVKAGLQVCKFTAEGLVSCLCPGGLTPERALDIYYEKRSEVAV